MLLRLVRILRNLTDFSVTWISYSDIVISAEVLNNVRALSLPIYLNYFGNSHSRPPPLHSLPMELEAALSSCIFLLGPCLSYAIGMLCSAMSFRKEFAN